MLSFVIPVYNEADNIDHLFDQFATLWSDADNELIFINDGSQDSTLEKLRLKKQSFPNLKIVNLSRNFGKDLALSAGLSLVAQGATTIAMDGDGQHSVEAVNKIIDTLERNADLDIVFGTRVDRAHKGPFTTLATKLLYRLLNMDSSRFKIREDVGDFFVARANATDAFRTYDSQRPFWKGFYGYAGFNRAYIDIDVKPRFGGKTKFGLRNQLSQ